MPGKLNGILSTGIALSFFALPARAVYAQVAEQTQLAANTIVTAAPKNTKDSATNPALETMQAQIKVQQLEIEEMRERVRKLEAMLEVVAANQTARPNLVAMAERAQPASSMAGIAGAAAAPAEGNHTKLDAYPGPVKPRSATASAQGATSRELLPDLGQIGAQVGLLVGGSQNPFRSDNGFFAGGYIDLPVKKVPGGKLSYEILVSMQRTTTDVQVTSGVIALVNSALNRELGKPPSVSNLLGPLPITNQAKERSTVLTVVPVAFKYTVTKFDHARFRPYFVAGLGTYVSLSTQTLTNFDAAKFVGPGAVADLVNAVLTGRQVAGLVPNAPELRARGIGQGQGDNRFGINFGGGFEFRISPRMSFGIDYRRNKIEGRNAGPYQTLTFKQGIHF